MADGSLTVKPFAAAVDDPLATEHAAVSKWVEDVVDANGRSGWNSSVKLGGFPSGRVLFDARPDEARRYVLAALTQVRHWNQELERIRMLIINQEEYAHANGHFRYPGCQEAWCRGRWTEDVISTLMRRALPLGNDDLITVLDWCSAWNHWSGYFAVIGHVTKALQRYASDHRFEVSLVDATRRLAERLRAWNDKNVKRLGTTLEQLCADKAESVTDKTFKCVAKPLPAPKPAGKAWVLDQLKRYFGILPAETNIPTTVIGPDRFALRDNSPLCCEHERLSDWFNEVVGTPSYSNPCLTTTVVGRAILRLDPIARGEVLLAATERHVWTYTERSHDYDDSRFWQSQYAAAGAVLALAESDFVLDHDSTYDFLLYFSICDAFRQSGMRTAYEKLLRQVAAEIASGIPLTEGERYVLHLVRMSRISGPPLGALSPDVARLTEMIGDGAMFYLVPGEAWSDAVNADIARLAPTQQQQWTALLKHLLTATVARPSQKWIKTAAMLVKAARKHKVRDAIARWLPLVAQGRTSRKVGAGDVIHEENATCLRGLLWLVPTLKDADKLAREVTSVALSAYKKIPGVGPRAVKVGNAAIYALSEMASPVAVGQLALLKVRVKFGTAQKEIEKAFNAAAEALGMPRDQIEEMGVPSYGLEEVGIRREIFAGGEFAAELRIDGRDVALSWSRADGKPLKSVPAKVKSEHKDDLKELQAAVKDVAGMLPAQAERVDALFLSQKRWLLSVWRERYLDHPLVGTIARRLIWIFRDAGNVERIGSWHDGQLVGVNDVALELPADTRVELWHPIGQRLDDVLAWRMWLERHQVRQPFKQAHREVYLLTDAERRTNTYSNRFAAHILRQHQFNALCAARGWKNKLRLMVDDTYPPASRDLSSWGLRAEFWIEGIGDEYGTDTNESGAYLRVATDQVRFYRTDAAANNAHAGGGGYTSNARGPGNADINEPLQLEEIPPLVLSEIMRDVDLFVGVASVGNDPNWADGGPNGLYRDYWAGYAFGELGETAKTRQQVLERLIPRLKIASRCGFIDRFLVVRGDRRTYKIHLGSGNILMEPNDQYLCIVKAPARDSSGQVFLPFEGDQTLSLILSKAFMLADDGKITDPTILRQIE